MKIIDHLEVIMSKFTVDFSTDTVSLCVPVL